MTATGPGATETSAGPELTPLIEELSRLVQSDSGLAAALLGTLANEARARSLPNVAARADYLGARAALNLSQLDQALELLESARTTWLAEGETLSALRTILGKMNVLDDLGRHLEAIEAGEGLLTQMDGLSSAGNEADWLRAAALENIGVAHGYLGDHRTAMEAYARAEQAYARCGAADDVARVTANRGVELIELGELGTALDALEQAAATFRSEGDELSLARSLAYRARAHLSAGDFLATLAATEEAGRHLPHDAATTEYARVQLVQADTLTSLNLVHEAESLYQAVLGRLEDAGLDHDRAVALLGLGTLYGRIGHPEATPVLIRASYALERVGDEPLAAVADLRRAQVTSDPASAVTIATEALDRLAETGRAADVVEAHLLLARVADDQHVVLANLDAASVMLGGKSRFPHIEWQLDHARGRHLLACGREEEGVESLARAVVGIDEIRSTVASESHRLPFMASRDAPHQDLLRARLAREEACEALTLVEQLRARTLVERLAAKRAADGMSPEEAIHLAARGAPTGPAAPARYVIYHVLDDEVLAFAVADGAIHVERDLTTVARLWPTLARLDAQWRRFEDRSLAARHREGLQVATVDLLQRLWIDLFAPLEKHLDRGPVTIVPHGIIAQIPFSALHDGTDHLISRFTLSSAPSITGALLAGNHTPRGRRLLVVGVPDARTPRLMDEVEAVAGTVGDATVMTGDAAPGDAILEALPHFDVVHLACHGTHRADNPLVSSLTVSDRMLTAAELTTVPLDGQLLVLSACSTARQGAFDGGAELVGLPRALLAAGASAVIVNLWQVDDSGSAELMPEFHRRLVSGDAATALRAAQLMAREHDSHPYLWAPTVGYGSPTTWRA